MIERSSRHAAPRRPLYRSVMAVTTTGMTLKTNQQGTGDQDQGSSLLVRWLNVQGMDPMLDFLEKQTLQCQNMSIPLRFYWRYVYTVSFSVIEAAPLAGVVSKVNMDFSRFRKKKKKLVNGFENCLGNKYIRRTSAQLPDYCRRPYSST